MFDKEIELNQEEIINLIFELFIRIWKANQTINLYKQQLKVLEEHKEKELEESHNKYLELERKYNSLINEHNLLVKKLNELEERNIYLQNDLKNKEQEIEDLKKELTKYENKKGKKNE